MPEKFRYVWFYASISKQQSADLDDYAKRLCAAYEQLDEAGYDVVQVVPISTGRHEPRSRRDGTYVGDATFSITQGAVVVGKERND